MNVTNNRLLDIIVYGLLRFFELENRVVVGGWEKYFLHRAVPGSKQLFRAWIANYIILSAINAEHFIAFEHSIFGRFKPMTYQERNRQISVGILGYVFNGIIRGNENDFSRGFLAREVGRNARSEAPSHDDEILGSNFFYSHEVFVDFKRIGKKRFLRRFPGTFPVSSVIKTDNIRSAIRRFVDKK